jgi:hypothetical protein
MSMCDFIWPRQTDALKINPVKPFAAYEDAIKQISGAAPSTDDPKLLTQSWKIFDNELARRNSIDTRAAAMMPAISLAVTLVTGVGFSVFKDATLTVVASLIIMTTFLVALIYLVRTMVLLFTIHGKVIRNTPDPSDLPVPALTDPAKPSGYDRLLACKIMTYTVLNYKVNNIQADLLFVAQRTFRNAILTIALGGALAGIAIFLNQMTAKAAPDSLKPILVQAAVN